MMSYKQVKSLVSIWFFCSLLSCSFPLFAADSTKFIIVNHFVHPLTLVDEQRTQVVPELLQPFQAEVGSLSEFTIVSVEGQKDAFISAIFGEDDTAFFAVRIENQHVKFTRLMASPTINYSWKGNTITICPQADYKKKGFCA